MENYLRKVDLGGVFDPQTVKTMSEILDAAWARVQENVNWRSPDAKTDAREAMAAFIVERVSAGEINALELIEAAVNHLSTNRSGFHRREEPAYREGDASKAI